jgi:hypothetical protein
MLSSLKDEEVLVADWMLDQLETDGVLFQADAACRIQVKFGSHHCHDTGTGHLAINNAVLYHLKRKTKGRVTWSPHTKSWRLSGGQVR